MQNQQKPSIRTVRELKMAFAQWEHELRQTAGLSDVQRNAHTYVVKRFIHWMTKKYG